MAPRSRSANRGSTTGASGAGSKAVYNNTGDNSDMSSSGNAPRRWTRSQSREVEAESVEPEEASDAGRQKGRRPGKKQKEKILDTIEESPNARGSNRRESTRESEDADAVNMSGTTILPSEPETDLDPDMMIESLPSLEREAKGVLNILAPGSVDVVSIVSTAKKLRDPQNPQSKRLKRFTANLDTEAQYFGHQTYIDATQVHRLVMSALAKKGTSTKDWTPDPVLHKANCARLALEVFLAQADSQRMAVSGLERFPSPFLNGLGEGPGRSTLEKETFSLALEIRTQSLLIKLQQHKDDSKVDPEAIISGVFFDPEDDEQLRGFGGSFQDEDGHLPERFAEAVHDRINEIRVTLAEDDDSLNIRGLQGAYGWQKFVLRVAQWIRKRDGEISRELQSQSNAEAVRDAYSLDEGQHNTSTDSPRVSVEYTEKVQKVPVQAPQEPSPAGKPSERKAKNPWMQSSVLQRLKQRSKQTGESSRRKTDFIRPATPERDTSRRISVPPGTTASVPEIPASPEGSPTLLQDEDIFFDANSNPQRNVGLSPERSHSPPMRRQPSATREQLRMGFPSSEEVWNAATRAVTPRPNPKPRKGAAFVDRQEHAQRVSPISETNSVQSRKRSRVDDDDDDDDEFTRYERAIDPDRRTQAQRQQQQQQQKQKKRRRIDDNDEPATAPERGNTPPIGSSTPQRSTPARPAPTPTRAAPSLARTGPTPTRPAPTPTKSAPTPPRPAPTRPAEVSILTDSKMRVRWSDEEDRRLLRLIRECGPRWAMLVRYNYVQPVQDGETRIQDRDSVQYKDRARNLKISYYREGRQDELPSQFKQVTMSKRDVESLQRRGIQIE